MPERVLVTGVGVVSPLGPAPAWFVMVTSAVAMAARLSLASVFEPLITIADVRRTANRVRGTLKADMMAAS